MTFQMKSYGSNQDFYKKYTHSIFSNFKRNIFGRAMTFQMKFDGSNGDFSNQHKPNECNIFNFVYSD